MVKEVKNFFILLCGFRTVKNSLSCGLLYSAGMVFVN